MDRQRQLPSTSAGEINLLDAEGQKTARELRIAAIWGRVKKPSRQE